MNTCHLLFRFGLFMLLAVGHSYAVGAQELVLVSEDERFKAQVEGDIAALERLLSEDLRYIHSNANVEIKADFLKSISTNSTDYQSMTLGPNRTLRRYGKMAVTNGTVRATGIVNGNPFDVNLLYTAVYQRKGKQWRIVNWQSTKMP